MSELKELERKVENGEISKYASININVNGIFRVTMSASYIMEDMIKRYLEDDLVHTVAKPSVGNKVGSNHKTINTPEVAHNVSVGNKPLVDNKRITSPDVVDAPKSNLKDFSLDHLQTQTLEAYGLSQEVNYSHDKFNSPIFIKKLKDLRVIRSKTSTWAPIGDTVIDAINDIRFVISEQAKGNKEPRELFRDMIYQVETFRLSLNPSTASNPFKKQARQTMVYFLTTGDLSSTTGLAWGKDNAGHGRILPFASIEEAKHIGPVIPSYLSMGWAQYRAQQIEWKGDFDGHNSDATNEEIKADDKKGRHETASPSLWEGISYAENYGVLVKVDATTSNSKDNVLSKVDTYVAYSSVWAFFLDELDGTGTLGHRGNLIGSKSETIGWSAPIVSYSDSLYYRGIFMEFGGAPKVGQRSWTWLDTVYQGDGGFNFKNWLLKRLNESTLPDGWDDLTAGQRIEMLSDEESGIKLNDGLYLSQYNFTFHKSVVTGDAKVYKSIEDKPITLSGHDSTETPTSIYNVLGSGTQAMYEDDNYDGWKNN